VPSFSFRSPLTELPSVIDVAFWHIASVIAVQRHVRSWVQTGSDRHIAKMTRLTHVRHDDLSRTLTSISARTKFLTFKAWPVRRLETPFEGDDAGNGCCGSSRRMTK
jgi:hypothetical protein